jgi:outer membrane biosynthesis protein TonB
MEHEAWPQPQGPSREPLPRVEDLPVAEQGYEQESVKAAFDSFYRHSAQLDAALRTLEAVDSFHRHAASLRADLRSLRAAGWTQQSWNAPPGYGYGMRAPREGIPPAVWRIAGEVALLVAVAVALGVAKVSWWVIVAAMGGAFLLVCLIEWLATRNQFRFEQPAAQPAVHPVVEAERVEETDEHDSLGWTAFEEAQEPSDAMTIIGAPPREAEADAELASPDVEHAVEPEPEVAPPPEPEPEPEEPDLPPAASEPAPDEVKEPRRWWRRKGQDEEPVPAATDSSSSVHVLPGTEANEVPASEEPTEDPLLVEEPGRRRSGGADR